MSIPKYFEFFCAGHECLKDGEPRSSKETIEFCAKYYNLSAEECGEKLQSGQSILSNRGG